MGMAASQARYLALVARKSNCEYEGQQINQARTALSNQSANLFNQMLGLQVPVPPSTQDFTRTQYSFTDGINASTISDWHQLAGDQEYNYVVTHHYYANQYTGFVKSLNDPQIQMSSTGSTTVTNSQLQAALLNIETKKQAYEDAKAARIQAEADMKDLTKYQDTTSYASITNCTYTPGAGTNDGHYTIDYAGPPSGSCNFYEYNNTSINATHITKIDEVLNALITRGALPAGTTASDYYNDILIRTIGASDVSIAFREDVEALVGNPGAISTTLPICYSGTGTSGVPYKVAELDSDLSAARLAETTALVAYNTAKASYESLNVPEHIGNSELTPLTSLDDDQKTEINQIIQDMQAQGVDIELDDCFNASGNYIGGIYTFKMNGKTYYTTLEDLKKSYLSGTGNNNIDGQLRLNYYGADYVSKKIEETEKALLETDQYGRFTSIRFENDSITYKLNMETITDDAAYDDAMNQFYYENAKYDKMVQDINSKTSLIHQQDRQLELRLKQLDTEHNALSQEIDAVKKVVDDNAEKSFKTFGG